MITQEILDAAMHDVVWRHDAKGRAESLKIVKQYIQDQHDDIQSLIEEVNEANVGLFPDGG